MSLQKACSALVMRGLGKFSHVAPGMGAAIAFRAMLRPRRHPRIVGAADARWRTPSGLVVHSWGESGPLVLCLHGWEGAALQFSGLATHLKSKGFRVWALDALAHGESGGRQATPLDLLEGLRELHALADEPVCVVGHSIGAAMIMFAMRERMPFVRSVLLSGPTSFDEVFAYFNQAIGLSPPCYLRLVSRLEKHIHRKLDSVSLIASPPGGSALIIHDSEDRQVPIASSTALVKVWPQAELWVTQGLGHRRILKSEVVWDRVAHYLAQI